MGPSAEFQCVNRDDDKLGHRANQGKAVAYLCDGSPKFPSEQEKSTRLIMIKKVNLSM